ncbi:MAG: hypothetical protein QMC67_05420 [Candidatus Wallbacteria bacterium]
MENNLNNQNTQKEISAFELFKNALDEKVKTGKRFICFAFEEKEIPADPNNKESKPRIEVKAMEPVIVGNINIAYVAQKAKIMKENIFKNIEMQEIAAGCANEREMQELLR